MARIVADYVENRDPWSRRPGSPRWAGRAPPVFRAREDATTARLRLLLVEPWARGRESAAAWSTTRLTARSKTKSASSSWVNADYNVPLENGDVLQTGSEGIAKIVFNDGTNYTVKQDSLIVIEKNSANEQQQNERGRRCEYWDCRLVYRHLRRRIEIARDRRRRRWSFLAPESAAMVHNDLRATSTKIRLRKEAASTCPRPARLSASRIKKGHLERPHREDGQNQDIGPPTHISPANMAPIFTSGGAKNKDVEFS